MQISQSILRFCELLMNDGEIFSSEIFFSDDEGYMQLRNRQVEMGSNVIFEKNVSRVYSKKRILPGW